MNETTNKIKELREEIDRIEAEIYKLERQNSNFYIGVCKVGDGDYWDEYYHRLGYTSEDKAKAWVEEQYKDYAVWDAYYFEVSEEMYDKYGDWKILYKLDRRINTYDTAIKNLDGVDEFKKTVSDAIQNVAREIGIEYLSFMHPADDVVC